jgi:hypothetical protein
VARDLGRVQPVDLGMQASHLSGGGGAEGP